MRNKLLVLVLLPIVLFAGTITKTLNFSEQDLDIQNINGYSLVGLKGLPSYQVPGSPIVPLAVYNVLVPSNAEVTEIKVLSKREAKIPGNFLLYPSQEPRPIGFSGEIPFSNPDQSIYSLSQEYPTRMVHYTSTGTKSGYRIGSFGVYPVRYIPSEKKLSLITELTIQIVYEENKVFEQTLTENQKAVFSNDVKSIVINPEDINRFSPSINVADENEIDFVIITSDAFTSNFNQLVEWHNKKGFRTEVKSLSTITSGYSGRDNQEKIRNFIRDYYTNRGLKYVLLAGDNSVVPARRARAIVGTYTGNIPSDLYYADLQWSWDANNNNIFGEANADTVDFLADIYIGRVSIDNTTEINTFINKIFTYEKNPDITYLKKILLPAAELWSNYNHMLSQDAIANISPSSWFDCEINQGTNTSLRYQVRDSLNAGYGLVHLVGHGDDVGVYISSSPQYYYTDPATQTNNNKLAIVNSIACYPGNFEYNDCLAEKMMSAQGCAVAVMMCSRYGWGTPPSIGPSELLDMSFYEYFFVWDSSLIGPCFSTSKDVNRYLAQDQQVWRWCIFELNLFGDPVMPMWNDVPSTVDVTYPSSIPTGPQNVQVQVIRGGSPVSNVIVGIYKPGDVFARGITNGSGQANIYVNALNPGMMYITTTGENSYPKEDSVVVTQGSAAPYIILSSITNGQTNPNTTTYTNAIITNTGTAPATNTIGKIRTNSTYITLIDSTSNYGTIAASGQSSGDAFSFFVASNTPAGTQIPFNLAITADQGTWNYNFNIQCGEPLQPGQIVANHDTGYCLLTVSAMGGIGYSAPSEKIGFGFRYPKTAVSSLYYGSMLAGNSAGYMVDRFYGQPATTLNQDWQIVDSLHFITPPIIGEQHLRCKYIDGGHTTPKGLKVTQNSYSVSDSRYDDFVVLVYDYENTGTNAINGLYSGIISDFDMPPDSSNIDVAGSDAPRRLVYMHRAASQNQTVGVKLLTPSIAANLSAVDHDIYVYPTTAMTDSMKYQFLNGSISLPQSNRTYDWSVVVSTGPFNLAPSQIYRVAYAYIGGTSEANLLTNADSVQVWYNRLSGIEEQSDVIIPKEMPTIDFSVFPNPSISFTRLSYNILNPGRLAIGLYDISGQLVRQLFNDNVHRSSGRIEFRLNNLPNGVYFVKLETEHKSVMKKLLLVK